MGVGARPFDEERQLQRTGRVARPRRVTSRRHRRGRSDGGHRAVDGRRDRQLPVRRRGKCSGRDTVLSRRLSSRLGDRGGRPRAPPAPRRRVRGREHARGGEAAADGGARDAPASHRAAGAGCRAPGRAGLRGHRRLAGAREGCEHRGRDRDAHGSPVRQRVDTRRLRRDYGCPQELEDQDVRVLRADAARSRGSGAGTAGFRRAIHRPRPASLFQRVRHGTRCGPGTRGCGRGPTGRPDRRCRGPLDQVAQAAVRPAVPRAGEKGRRGRTFQRSLSDRLRGHEGRVTPGIGLCTTGDPERLTLTRMCHRSIFRAALLLATVGTSAAGQTPRPPDQIALTRLNTDDLEIGESGVLVIRDSASWIRLWRYFGREYRPDRVATPPTVDFARYTIVAVGYGARSGCGNRAFYINRLESAKDRIRVVLGPDEPPRPELTCMMIINPVDAVVVERDSRRLTFVAARAGYPIPPRAQWLTPPSVDAALDTGRSVRKQVAWRVLPRDSTRPFNDLRRLARAASAGIGPGLDLLANARVRRSPELLTILGTGPHALPLAREYLFQLHADRVATDPASDTAAFWIILEKLQGDEHPDIARSLVDNRALRKNSLLLRELIRKVWRDSVTCHAAARVYLSHWPSPSDYYMSSPCQPPSDLTRLRRP